MKTITVKTIFNEIQSMNPRYSTVSSIGRFISDQALFLANEERKEIISCLPPDSFAHKVAMYTERFSEKQLWVIAYELMKNEEYKTKLAERIEKFEEEIRAEREFKAARRAARKAAREALEKEYKEINSNRIVKHEYLGVGKVISESDKDIIIFFKKHGEKRIMKEQMDLLKEVSQK